MPLRVLFPAIALVAALALGTASRAASPLPPQPADVPWPTAEWPEGELGADVDRAAVEAAAAALFAPRGRGGLPDTRALLVVRHGRLVFERYAEGFGERSRFRSWSAGKSVTNALVGILVREGKLALDEPPPVPEWRIAGDPRAAITLRQLLQMSAGLDNEDGGEGADSFVARLLFGDLSGDTAHGAAQRDVLYAPGTHWAYSTGTSQILSGIVARKAGARRGKVTAFVSTELAAPLGARSLLVAFDGVGTPLGGAYVFASARDWARLGLLYLRDGVWDGRRVLPDGWVEFTRTPAPAENNGNYGAHFWLSVPPAAGQPPVLRSGIEAFAMQGNGGQFVGVLPDRDLVVVRLGELHRTGWAELQERLADLVAPFPAAR